VQQLRQQGIQQGIQQESRETALRMLENKFDLDVIAKITQLPIEELRLLAKNKSH
jgi:predicted transposase/invertase (TIGR01784 family)